MFTARLLASSADKRWDHSASVTAAEPATPHTHKPPALITRQAGSTAYLLPFDTDMWYSLVTDAAQHWSQRSQITFWIVFFFPSPSVAKNYLFDDGRQCYPGHRMELEVVAACLLRSHLPQMNCVCVHTSGQVNACLRQCGRWEGFLTTVVRLMPSTELNCCMTTLLFRCHGDFLLLSSMNHR